MYMFDSGLQRCGKSCRLRWINYLRPDIRRGRFSPEEEKLIISLHAVVGNRFSTFLFVYLTADHNFFFFINIIQFFYIYN